MTPEQISRQYQDIIRLLDQKELSSALTHLATSIQKTNEWPLQEELNEIRTSYEYMLDYLRRGSSDPQRHAFHTSLLIRAYKLNDTTRHALTKRFSTTLLSEKLRLFEKLPPRPIHVLHIELEHFHHEISQLPDLPDRESLPTLIPLCERHEQALNELFHTTWASLFWNEAEKAEADALLQSEQTATDDKALFISALTLSLMDHFDPAKIHLLLQFLLRPEADKTLPLPLYARALTAVALTAYLYDRRIPLHPDIAGCYSLLSDLPSFSNALALLQLQLLYSRESPKTEIRIKEEILPDFLRRTHQQMDKFHLGEDSFFNEKMEKNPEWEEALQNSGMADMMEELQNMMAQGEDIFLSSFAQIKNYPFFRELTAWLMPFGTYRSHLLRALQNQPADPQNSSIRLPELIGEFHTMCDSDKYSFLLTLYSIPEAQRSMVINGLSAQTEELKALSDTPAASLREIMRHYVQDFYRFLNLYSRRSEFANFFRTPLYLFHTHSLQTALSDSESLRTFAEFFFRKELWSEAESLYRSLTESASETDHELYQKLGYSLQQQEKYRSALQAYSQADLLRPDQKWTLRNQAFCARKMGHYEDALTFLERLRSMLKGSPSSSLLMQIGTCHLMMEKIPEAMQLFFEAEYIDEHSPRPWRSIAWCSFLSGKLPQARRYYEKLLALPQPSREDHLNAAHTAWAMNETAEAVTLYSKALAGYPNFEAFHTVLRKDTPHLIHAGVIAEDIPLMIDLLRSGVTHNP